MEPDLLAITGLGGEAGATAVWPALRAQLLAAGLIGVEALPGVIPPFLRFHPTLAPLLWQELDADARERLGLAHRERYAQLATYLYHEDTPNPEGARAIAQRELPNLLAALQRAFDAWDPEAVDFADSVLRFLRIFGRKREADAIQERLNSQAGETGSDAWFLAEPNRGDQLHAAGRAGEAIGCFDAILAQLPTEKEDFGQTLGVWGIAPGAYLVLPVLGPSNVRDTVGTVVDAVAFSLVVPNKIEDKTAYKIVQYGIQPVHARANNSFRYHGTGSPFEYELVRFAVTEGRQMAVTE